MTAVLASDVIVRTSTGEAVMFWVLSALALLGAVGVVLAVNAVYSAMFLAMTMIILAVFYMAQDALFLGVVQVVVYTGAVMMLFLFVLMLIGVDSAESLKETLRGQRVAAVLTGVGFGVLLISTIGQVATRGFAGLTVAHRQRHFQPARRGNDHVDPVGKAHVDQFGYPGQQRITGVELIGVIAAEAIEIVDDQEHLTEPVVGGRAISTPVTEYFPLLPGQQQLLELAEGAADAFGFQR